MAEGFKINLLDRDKDRRLWNLINAMEVTDNTIIIGGHGTPYHISDDRKGKSSEQAIKLSPLDLAKMIVEEGARHGLDEKTVQSMKIVLSSCSTGQGQKSFARELSHYFSEVVAPTRDLSIGDVDYSDNFQFAKIYGSADDEVRFVERGERLDIEVVKQGKSDVNDPGRMKTFYSTDYMYYQAHPESDNPESERPFSKQPVYDQKSGKHIDGRDAGNDQMINSLDSPYALSPRVAVHDALEQRAKRDEYRADMAATYLDAAKSNTTETWMNALNKYPLLASAYNYRTEMARRASESSIVAPQYEQGLDGYVVQSIKHGSVRELIPPPIEQLQSSGMQPN